MATVNYSVDYGEGRHYIVVTWAGMVGGDDGRPINLPEWADKTAQATGTIGAVTTIDVEGSNDGTNFGDLRSPDSVVINLVPLNTVKAVLENPMWVRPVIGAGASATITVKFVCTQKRAR